MTLQLQQKCVKQQKAKNKRAEEVALSLSLPQATLTPSLMRSTAVRRYEARRRGCSSLTCRRAGQRLFFLFSHIFFSFSRSEGTSEYGACKRDGQLIEWLQALTPPTPSHPHSHPHFLTHSLTSSFPHSLPPATLPGSPLPRCRSSSPHPTLSKHGPRPRPGLSARRVCPRGRPVRARPRAGRAPAAELEAAVRLVRAVLPAAAAGPAGGAVRGQHGLGKRVGTDAVTPPTAEQVHRAEH